MTTATIISAILANQEQWVAAAIAENRESYADQNKIGEVKVDVVRAMMPGVYRRRDGTLKRYPDQAFEVSAVYPKINNIQRFRVTFERISTADEDFDKVSKGAAL